MKKSIIAFVFLFSFAQSQAQRLPYPIIFVHGWIGSDETWYGMGDFLQSYGLSVNLDPNKGRGANGSRIDFHLNADGINEKSVLDRNGGPEYYGDVYDYNSSINPENDVFFVNFENDFIAPLANKKEYSNQAAVVKQGFAVGLAVKKVLNATKAKKVVLVGHSMGGLAIREYLQNSENWLMGDGDSHVAKLVTIGTPNAGSNSTLGNIASLFQEQDERSESVRDLRHPKNNTDSEVDRGVYLFGGDERNIFRLGLYGLQYFNNDVNCDGKLGEVRGLNQKAMPDFIPFSCVIGTGSTIPGIGSSNGDGVVEAGRASLFTGFTEAQQRELIDEVFYLPNDKEELGASQYYSKIDKSPIGTWHTKLTKQVLTNMAAIDEPSHGSVAYSIDLNKAYTGFLTKRPDGTLNDSDLFKIFVDKPGVLTVNLTAEASANAQIVLYDQNWFGSAFAADKSQLKLNVTKQGTYYVEIKGNNWNGDIVRKYSFSTSFCSLDLPFFSVSGSTTLCEGSEVLLSAEANFEAYQWYKDAQPIPSNSPQLTVAKNQLTVSQTGKYTLEAQKCGVWLKPDNGVNVTVKPLPTKPTITKEEVPGKTTLTSSIADGIQWHKDGAAIDGATLAQYVALQSGNYSVRNTANGCSNQSEVMSVTVIPILGVDPQKDLSLMVFPNPNNGVFSLELPDESREWQIDIMDAHGKSVIHQKQGKQIQIKTPAGTYFLRVSNSKIHQTVKFLLH